MSIWKPIYLNCGERYEFMIDHRSFIHTLSSCEIQVWKKIQAWMGFKPMTSAILVQCTTKWTIIKPTGSLSLCQFVKIEYMVKNTNEYISKTKLWRNIWRHDHYSYKQSLSSCEIKAQQNFRPEWDLISWPLQYQCSAGFNKIPQ